MATSYTERQAKVTFMDAASTFYQWRKDEEKVRQTASL